MKKRLIYTVLTVKLPTFAILDTFLPIEDEPSPALAANIRPEFWNQLDIERVAGRGVAHPGPAFQGAIGRCLQKVLTLWSKKKSIDAIKEIRISRF